MKTKKELKPYLWYKITTFCGIFVPQTKFLNSDMKDLGKLIKDKRIKHGYTLRGFCQTINADPSNWSKIERGLLKFPTSLLDEIAEVLNLNNEEVQEIKELSMIQTISKDMDVNERVLEALPVFFRTTRDLKPSEEQLKELIDILKRN